MPPLLLTHGTPSTGNGSSGGVTYIFWEIWIQQNKNKNENNESKENDRSEQEKWKRKHIK